jgi:aldose sugar dehydrogenase
MHGTHLHRSRLGRLVASLAALTAVLLLAITLLPTTRTSAAPAAQSTPFNVEVVAQDLATIWAVDFAPDGRIFLTERSGRIRTITDGALDPQPWTVLDVTESGESGLMGLALDPEFATNGFVYVAYTYTTAGGEMQNRLVRLREDPATRRGATDAVLLDDVRGGRVHDGARVKIGPDGKLYMTMGDSGSAELAQGLDTLNGKIIRLNTDGSIPDDNPFPGSPIYSYGHRNPQGLAWHPATGQLFAIEHGPSGAQSCCDEVNLILPGQNYGWPRVTGDQQAEGMIPPLIHSGNSRETTWAPGGATFVTGGPWAGSLLFTGLRGQALYRVTVDPTNLSAPLALERHFEGQYGRLRDIVEGPDGALYLATVPTPATTSCCG